jgi:D-3-phosphoglycerate dehydrogenase / 2-oxoglutarate reductase
VEGTVFEPNDPRIVSVDGVTVEAPLGGTMILYKNDDLPGVIGEVGTILGRHRINIATFDVGRSDAGAVGIVSIDETAATADALNTAVEEIRRIEAVRDAWLIRLG